MALNGGYQAGRDYAARWLERDHRPIGNTAGSYAVLSRARARDEEGRFVRGFCLGVARVCRENLHRDAVHSPYCHKTVCHISCPIGD